MKKLITFALVLTGLFISCNTQESTNQQAQQFIFTCGDYSFDLLSDTIDIYALFPERYFDTDPENYLEPLCAHNEYQYVIYKGTNETAQNYADYYNALIMVHNLHSDCETALRFGEEGTPIYQMMADSIGLLDCSVICNDTLRTFLQYVRDNMADYVRNSLQDDNQGDLDKAFSELLGFISAKVGPVMENSEELYSSYMARVAYFNNFDSVVSLRGRSDNGYKQEILTNLYLAQTPAERHIYAIEFAHSDSTNADFLVGAAVLNHEFFYERQYSPYLSEMWRTWRACMSSLIGLSSWSYIPNVIYNQERALIAEIIVKYIEDNPSDILAQGVLIDLGSCDNISRRGSFFGNASLSERRTVFPEGTDK